MVNFFFKHQGYLQKKKIGFSKKEKKFDFGFPLFQCTEKYCGSNFYYFYEKIQTIPALQQKLSKIKDKMYYYVQHLCNE